MGTFAFSGQGDITPVGIVMMWRLWDVIALLQDLGWINTTLAVLAKHNRSINKFCQHFSSLPRWEIIQVTKELSALIYKAN